MSPVWILFKKELLDVVRDRRTLVLGLLLPIVLYPGLLAVMGLVISAGRERLKNEQLVVAVVGADARGLLGRTAAPAKTTYQAATRAEAEAALRDQKVAAVIDAVPQAERALDSGGQAQLTVLYSKRYDRSMEALERMRKVLDGLNTASLEGRLKARHLDARFAVPLKAEVVDLDFQQDMGPFIASRLLPILLVVMLLMGALYPAVDLTAGEKERGTFETLLVASVRPLDVMAAKYFTVSLVALVTALVNLGVMSGTFGVGLAMGEGVSVSVHFASAQLAALVLCLVPAAFLVAGLSLAVASVARTFKEGQALMSPVLLVGMAPALLAQMPGIELSAYTALVPMLNIALLVKAAALGTVQPLHVALTFASVTVTAVGALFLAARAFESEAFRFGGVTPWGRLWRVARARLGW